MPRPDNTIEKVRSNAWHLMTLSQHKLWNETWAGEDLLMLDNLCCKLYDALRSKDKEKIAVAKHLFEETYDVGADGRYPPPGVRPPEITAQLKNMGLIA